MERDLQRLFGGGLVVSGRPIVVGRPVVVRLVLGSFVLGCRLARPDLGQRQPEATGFKRGPIKDATGHEVVDGGMVDVIELQ